MTPMSDEQWQRFIFAAIEGVARLEPLSPQALLRISTKIARTLRAG